MALGFRGLARSARSRRTWRPPHLISCRLVSEPARGEHCGFSTSARVARARAARTSGAGCLSLQICRARTILDIEGSKSGLASDVKRRGLAVRRLLANTMRAKQVAAVRSTLNFISIAQSGLMARYFGTHTPSSALACAPVETVRQQ